MQKKTVSDCFPYGSADGELFSFCVGKCGMLGGVLRWYYGIFTVWITPCIIMCIELCVFGQKNRKIFISFFMTKRLHFGGKIKLFSWTYGERYSECDIMLCVVVFSYYVDYDFFITYNCLHLPSYGVWYSTNRFFELFVMKHLRVNVLTIL